MRFFGSHTFRTVTAAAAALAAQRRKSCADEVLEDLKIPIWHMREQFKILNMFFGANRLQTLEEEVDWKQIVMHKDRSALMGFFEGLEHVLTRIVKRAKVLRIVV